MSAVRTPLRAPTIILGAILCVSAPVRAQSPSPPETPADGGAMPEFDPGSDMAPLPDIGVDWPDASDENAPPPSAATDPAAPATVEPAPAGGDGQSDRRYRVSLDGLNGNAGLSVEAEAALRTRFRML